MRIEGANTTIEDAKLQPLSQMAGNQVGKKILKFLEKQYIKNVRKCNNLKVNKMEVKEDSVVIKPGMLNHICSSNIEVLESISKFGILASEWFGKIESEYEGIFCAFADKTYNDEDFNGKGRRFNKRATNPNEDRVILFFDTENQIAEKILHFDFFKYLRDKQSRPEMLNQLYTKEELAVFQEIIEPYSTGAEFVIRNSSGDKGNWVAIPGGIPSQLINGICINERNSKEYIEKISDIFPNATIFDNTRKVLREPIIKEEKITGQKIGKATINASTKDKQEVEQFEQENIRALDKTNENEGESIDDE